MATTTDIDTIERVLEIDASPETVWEFLVDPDKACRWMGVNAWLDPRPGGRYRVEVLPGRIASGQFVEVDPPRRLVHTFGWEHDDAGTIPPGASTIEIELEPRSNGTTLRFSHRDVPTAESRERHGHGWNHYLDRLQNAAAGHNPGPDPWVDQGPQ